MDNEDNVRDVKSWVNRYNHDENLGMTNREVDLAAKIGADTFKGNTGIGQAAENGIAAVKRMRE